MEADPDDGVSTDELMGCTGLSSEGVRKALHDLEAIGVASNDTPLTAFVDAGVERSLTSRLEDAMTLERAMIEKLRKRAPELSRGERSTLHVRGLTQALLDEGVEWALPERLRRILKSLAKGDHGEETGHGSLSLRSRDRETIQVTLLRSWSALSKSAELRRKAAQALLEKLLSRLPRGTRGTALLVKTTFGELRASLTEDLLLKAEIHDFDRLMEHAVLWLHEQEVIRINKGLVVFSSAMTIRLDERGGSFLKADFEPLQQHCNEQTVQIHVMAGVRAAVPRGEGRCDAARDGLLRAAERGVRREGAAGPAEEPEASPSSAPFASTSRIAWPTRRRRRRSRSASSKRASARCARACLPRRREEPSTIRTRSLMPGRLRKDRRVGSTHARSSASAARWPRSSRSRSASIVCRNASGPPDFGGPPRIGLTARLSTRPAQHLQSRYRAGS